MIISHEHQYLFIEIPHTGSTAISAELRDLYGGESILKKHAMYQEFLQIASPAERGYFTFAGIRNPLDEAVTLYAKYKSNHDGRYTNAKKVASSLTGRSLEHFQMVHEEGADFASYFRRVYRLPYSSIGALAYPHCDYLIRFENLADDFAAALQQIGLTPLRPLPQRNKTRRDADFRTFYTPEIIPHAQRIFGPYMQQWRYNFPPDWPVREPSTADRLRFQLTNLIRNFYWKHIRWSPRFYGKLARRFR